MDQDIIITKGKSDDNINVMLAHIASSYNVLLDKKGISTVDLNMYLKDVSFLLSVVKALSKKLEEKC